MTSYSFIVQNISSLEKQSLSLNDSLKILEQAIERVNGVICNTGRIVSEQFKKILSKSPDLTTIQNINKMINDHEYSGHIDFPIENVEFLQMCNLTSVDTERSFSRYKLIVDDRRHFKFDNLNKYFFLNANAYFDE